MIPLSTSSKLGLIVAGCFLCPIFRIENTTPFLYYPELLMALSIYFSTLFLPRKLLIYPLFLIILVMPELTQSSDELDLLGVIKSANLWQFSFGIFTPATLIFLMLMQKTYFISGV